MNPVHFIVFQVQKRLLGNEPIGKRAHRSSDEEALHHARRMEGVGTWSVSLYASTDLHVHLTSHLTLPARLYRPAPHTTPPTLTFMPAGLKEGGHHRRGIDVAQKKAEEKRAAQEVREKSGEFLRKLLQLDPDLDIYLSEGTGSTDPESQVMHPARARPLSKPLCWDHFKRESCSNRRCKFSHSLSIASARPIEDVDEIPDEAATDKQPTLTLLRGYGPRPSNTRTFQFGIPTEAAAGLFEPLPESVVDVLLEFACLDADLGSFGTCCRRFRLGLLVSTEASKRKANAVPALNVRRAQWLVQSKNASRVRYAVSYSAMAAAPAESPSGRDGKPRRREKSKKGTADGSASVAAAPAPVLAFDFEREGVFRAFERSARAASASGPFASPRASAASASSPSPNQPASVSPASKGLSAPQALAGVFPRGLGGLPEQGLSFILALSRSAAAGALACASKDLRSAVRLDPGFRRRRREALEQLQAPANGTKKNAAKSQSRRPK